MRDFLPLPALALVLSALFQPSLASATVLGFDDLADGVVPVNYGGLDWSASGWTVFSMPADPYTPSSGAGRIATEFAGADAGSLIAFLSPVQFEGAYFSGLGGAQLSFQLFSGGTLVHQTAALDPSATPSFLASGYIGLVDAVRVSSANHGEFVMDDLSFSAAPVPEPQTYGLMLAGLAVLGWAAQRRQRSN